MQVTLKDIAQKSGVSLQTVSRILRGQHKMHRPETCEKVMAVAKEMGYQPNMISRMLLGKQSMSIGLLVRGFGGYMPIARLRRIMSTAMENDYLTYLIHLDYGADESLAFIRGLNELVSRRIDGLIVYRSLPVPPAALELLNKQRLPKVFLDWAPSDAKAALVFERKQAITELVKHLADLGHRRGTLFVSPGSIDYPGQKIEHYQTACQAYNIKMEMRVVPALSDQAETQHHAYVEVKQFLERAKARKSEMPTVLMMANDEAALGALGAARDLGMSVPKDLSITGFDDISAGRYAKPALTTIQTPREEVGMEAFNMLHEMIKNPACKGEVRRVHMKTIFRESTGPAAG
jgi:DNA-binding LacI/PurR family transcriptional regulator